MTSRTPNPSQNAGTAPSPAFRSRQGTSTPQQSGTPARPGSSSVATLPGPDKQRLLIAVLRAAKDEGIAPPSGGVQVFPGRGTCRIDGDKVVVFADAPIESWLAQAVAWVEYAVAVARTERVRAVAKAEGGDDPYARIRKVELDDAAPVAGGPSESVATRMAKVEAWD